jgi:hypothetical protein
MELTIVAFTPTPATKLPKNIRATVKDMLKRSKIDGNVLSIPGAILVRLDHATRDEAIYLLRTFQRSGYIAGVQV